MEIKSISVKSEGYIHCNSAFYSSHNVLHINSEFAFRQGINELVGEIDSEGWSISYLLSMYAHRPKDFYLTEPPVIFINSSVSGSDEVMQYSCYMDRLYPLFSGNKTVKSLVEQGIKKTSIGENSQNIRDMFRLSADRFERPISCVGNEVFRAMAAIGYSHGKQLFCFPWLSSKRFEGYHGHLTDLLDILKMLNTTVILPIGQ